VCLSVCQLQNHAADKPVKCYSESDGDAYLSDMTAAHQAPVTADTQMTSLTEVRLSCCFVVVWIIVTVMSE